MSVNILHVNFETLPVGVYRNNDLNEADGKSELLHALVARRSFE